MAVIRSVLNTWNGRHRVTDMCHLHLLQSAGSFRVAEQQPDYYGNPSDCHRPGLSARRHWQLTQPITPSSPPSRHSVHNSNKARSTVLPKSQEGGRAFTQGCSFGRYFQKPNSTDHAAQTRYHQGLLSYTQHLLPASWGTRTDGKHLGVRYW